MFDLLIWKVTKRNALHWATERKVRFLPIYQHKLHHLFGGWLKGRRPAMLT